MFSEFDKFLDALVNPEGRAYEKAWREFECRYQKMILYTIQKIIRNSEIVKDIAQEVMQRLIASDFKAIKNFRERQSEAAFKVFLNQIARNAALSHYASLTSHETLELVEELFNQDDCKKQRDTEELHKYLIMLSRAAYSYPPSQTSESRMERDIFILALRFIGAFRSKELALIPLLNINYNDVDTVVARVKKRILDNINWLRDFK